MESTPGEDAEQAQDYSEVEATREAVRPDVFQIVMATLVALVALVGAIASCGLDKRFDDASDADAAGVTSLVNYSDNQTGSVLRGLENYRSYVVYKRYQVTADLLRQRLAAARTPEERASITSQIDEAESSATSYLPGLSRYIDPAVPSGYDIDRNIGEEVTLRAGNKDLGFDDYFESSNSLRADGQRLLKVPLILAFSVVLLTVAEGTRSRLRFAVAGGAFVIAVASFAMIVTG